MCLNRSSKEMGKEINRGKKILKNMKVRAAELREILMLFGK